MKIRGQVVKGSSLGRKLGYPTANISVDASLDATDGVYTARVATAEGKSYDAMANLGTRPTFSDNRERLLEVHLFNFDGDLYGQTIDIELLDFIRPELKFASSDELKTQIKKDKDHVYRHNDPV